MQRESSFIVAKLSYLLLYATWIRATSHSFRGVSFTSTLCKEDPRALADRANPLSSSPPSFFLLIRHRLPLNARAGRVASGTGKRRRIGASVGYLPVNGCFAYSNVGCVRKKRSRLLLPSAYFRFSLPSLSQDCASCIPMRLLHRVARLRASNAQWCRLNGRVGDVHRDIPIFDRFHHSYHHLIIL